MWDLTYPRYLAGFHRCSEVSGVSTIEAHPYTLRHGGASDDALKRRRSFQGIQDRGRWRTEASVRRYKKHARVMKEAERLPKATREYGLAVERSLGPILLGHASSPAPPFLHNPRLRARARR